MGALLVCNGEVVAAEAEATRRLGAITAHAELLVLQAARQKLGRTRQVAKTVGRILHNLFTLDTRFARFSDWWEGLMRDRRGKNYAGSSPTTTASGARLPTSGASPW